MPTQQVLSTVRPQRSAFLISTTEAEWESCALRLLDHCMNGWGGYGSIFVPTDGKTISKEFWWILESFEPDHIGRYMRTGRDICLDDPDRFEAILENHVNAWERQTGERLSFQVDAIRKDLERMPEQNLEISSELVTELKVRLNPFHFEDHVVDRVITVEASPQYPDTQLKHILKALREPPPPAKFLEFADKMASLWAGTEIGFATGGTALTLEMSGLKIQRETSPITKAFEPVLAHIPGFNNRQNTTFLADATWYGLGMYGDRSYHDWEAPTLVIAGRTLEDYCLYQSLSRMRSRVVWLPPWFIGATVDAANSLSDEWYFVSALKHLTEFGNLGNKNVHIASYSLADNELEALLDGLTARGLDKLNWQISSTFAVLNFKPLRLFEANNVHYPQIANVDADSKIELFSPRQPKSLHSISPQEIRWISELKFPGWQIPTHPALAPWMMGVLANEARTSRNALSFLNVKMMVFGTDDAESAGVRPTIRLPKALDVFQVVAASANLSVSSSDKGIYAKTLVEKFGSLGKATVFFRSNLGGKLVDLYQQRGKSKSGIFLQDERRLYLDFETISSLAGNSETALALVDEFSLKGIFYRGFIFQCEYCRRSTWFPISDLTDQFVCKRCHREQTYTSKHWKIPEQPRWYYQLDEVVFQALVNDCHVPLLAMSVLSVEANGQLGFTEELEYRRHDNSEILIESDINCVVDGKIAIGEAKKADRLAKSAKEERRIAERYAELARLLHAEIVVFATAEGRWRDSTTHTVEEVFKGERAQVRLLASANLYGA